MCLVYNLHFATASGLVLVASMLRVVLIDHKNGNLVKIVLNFGCIECPMGFGIVCSFHHSMIAGLFVTVVAAVAAVVVVDVAAGAGAVVVVVYPYDTMNVLVVGLIPSLE